MVKNTSSELFCLNMVANRQRAIQRKHAADGRVGQILTAIRWVLHGASQNQDREEALGSTHVHTIGM